MKAYFAEFRQNNQFYVLLIAAVAVAVMLPVLIFGLPGGYDLPHHFQCAATFYESILSGDFYPSWSLNRNFGYGGMETRLYPPLSHYSLAVAYLIVGNWHLATWLILTLFAFLGGYAVYLWAREYMSANQAAFAGCIYILLPYHLNQVYNTFFFAEFVGSSLLPFTFVFVSRVCRRGKTSDVIGLAISFAVLILTHLPLTVIGSICFAIYGISLLRREKILPQVLKLAIGVFGGLAASSFFWIKVLQERDLLAKTSVYSDLFLDYRLHFLITPFQTYEGIGVSVYENATFYYDLMFFYTVVMALACAVPFLVWLKQKDKLIGVWLVFAVSVFLIIPLSRFVWDVSPLLQEVQFPWRWLSIVSITASVLSASKLNYLLEWFKGGKRPFALMIAGSVVFIVVFSVSQIIRPAPFIPKDEVSEMLEVNAKAKGFIFWWTIWAREGFAVKDKILAGSRNVQIENWTATEKDFQISAGEAVEARVAVFYHPNWKAVIDDVPTETKPDENGVVIISVPNQASLVKLTFRETFGARIGCWLSALCWLSLILFLIWRFTTQSISSTQYKRAIFS